MTDQAQRDRDNDVYCASYVCGYVIISIILLLIRVINKWLLPATQSHRMKTGFRVVSSFIKRHLLYAPLFRFKRATYVTTFKGKLILGTLPSRMQSLFLAVVLGVNVFLTFWNLPYSSDTYTFLIAIAHRSGTVAIANFIPIVITANHQNPLIYLLDIPFDSFVLFHRWVARMTFFEIILHGVTRCLAPGYKYGWAYATHQLLHVFYFTDGLVAGILITLVLILAVKPIRVRMYHTFHYSHIILLIPTFALTYIHLPDLNQRWFLVAAACLWGAARLMWLTLTVYRSLGTSKCSAHLEELPEGATRVLIDVPRDWTFNAGQSLSLALPGVDWTGAHPFSIVWSDKHELVPEAKSTPDDEESSASSTSDHQNNNAEKLPEYHHNACSIGKQTLHCIVKRQSGLTRELHRLAMEISKSETPTDCASNSLKAWVSGPHGKQQDLYWYNNVLLVAGGVGITAQIPYVYSLLMKRLKSARAPSKIHLVWSAPSLNVLEWITPCLRVINELRQTTDAEVVLQLYVTKKLAGGENGGDPLPTEKDGFEIRTGRPDFCDLIKNLVDGEITKKSYISVCGASGMSDDLRRSVRRSLKKGNDLAFHEEGFSW